MGYKKKIRMAIKRKRWVLVKWTGIFLAVFGIVVIIVGCYYGYFVFLPFNKIILTELIEKDVCPESIEYIAKIMSQYPGKGISTGIMVLFFGIFLYSFSRGMLKKGECFGLTEAAQQKEEKDQP